MDSVRTALQTLLVELFPTSSDFEAFFIGAFSSIYRLVSSGMNRLDQINLLFGQAAPHQIVHALFVHFHGDLKTLRLIEARIAALDSEDARAEFDLNQSILELTQELVERRSRGVPADVIAGKLKELKKRRRELREGPGLRAGDELGGRYKLLTLIGEGGFATVWQAFDVQGQLVVAIKVLHGEKAASQRSRERFDRGARILRSLNHPHIVRLLDEPKVDRNYHYVALEYAAGGDLDKAVLKSAQPKDVLWRAVIQTADALSHAHAAGLTHRDVKPENILLTVAGVAKLTDFDLVQDEASSGGSRTGGMGTLLYAAPEQRFDASRVDHRADIYSLGMTAVFVLHGKRLPAEVFENEGRQAFIAKLDCPKALRDVLRKAVDADRSKRYQRMTELCMDLERAATPWLLAKPSQPAVATSAAPPRKTSRATLFGLAVFVGVGSGVVGLGVYLNTPSAPRDPSAPVLVAHATDAGFGPLDASLARVSQTGGFALVSEPPGAAVSLDGASLGQVTPLRVQSVLVGKHSLELRLGSRSLTQEIVVEGGKTIDFKLTLPPETVSQSAPEQKPAPLKKTEDRQMPRPKPGAVAIAKRQVAKNVGFLRIKSKPSTKIFVDGMDTNLATPQTAYQMSPGMHQIMLFDPEFGFRETFSVHIIAGETQTVLKDFLKDLPEVLDRGTIMSTLKGANFAPCKVEGAPVVIAVKLIIGRNGMVTEASGPNDCVVNVIKGVKFPAFSGDPMSLTYPALIR